MQLRNPYGLAQASGFIGSQSYLEIPQADLAADLRRRIGFDGLNQTFDLSPIGVHRREGQLLGYRDARLLCVIAAVLTLKAS